MDIDTDSISVSRRRLVQGGFIATFLAGGIGTLLMRSEPVMAASLSISDAEATTDDGTISSLTIKGMDVTVTWDGAEQEPGDTCVKLQVKDGSYSKITQTPSKSLTGLSGETTFEIGEQKLTGNILNTDMFMAGTDGSKNSETLDFKATIETGQDLSPNDGDGGANPKKFTQSTTATVTINNQPVSTQTSGSGDLAVQK